MKSHDRLLFWPPVDEAVDNATTEWLSFMEVVEAFRAMKFAFNKILTEWSKFFGEDPYRAYSHTFVPKPAPLLVGPDSYVKLSELFPEMNVSSAAPVFTYYTFDEPDKGPALTPDGCGGYVRAWLPQTSVRILPVVFPVPITQAPFGSPRIQTIKRPYKPP